MKRTMIPWFVSVLLLTASTTLVRAADPTLKIGDPAPALQPGQWVQGEPVKQFEKGKTYIVEFWATWCGPCRVSIPHVNEIYNKYKDKGLVVIGQDCWERDDKLVAPFVKTMGDKMTYRVALDNKEGGDKGKMAETWMVAAGQDGIPTAFVVNAGGVIAWIGHPMTLTEKTTEEVLAGKFDIKAAAVEYNRQQQEEAKRRKTFQLIRSDVAQFHQLISSKDYPGAYKLAASMSETHKDEAWLQNELAWDIATDKSIEQRDLALAETIATRGNEATKGQDPATMDTLARIQFMRGHQDQAIATEEKAVGLANDKLKENLQKALDGYRKGVLPDADY